MDLLEWLYRLVGMGSYPGDRQSNVIRTVTYQVNCSTGRCTFLTKPVETEVDAWFQHSCHVDRVHT